MLSSGLFLNGRSRSVPRCGSVPACVASRPRRSHSDVPLIGSDHNAQLILSETSISDNLIYEQDNEKKHDREPQCCTCPVTSPPAEAESDGGIAPQCNAHCISVRVIQNGRMSSRCGVRSEEPCAGLSTTCRNGTWRCDFMTSETTHMSSDFAADDIIHFWHSFKVKKNRVDPPPGQADGLQLAFPKLIRMLGALARKHNRCCR